jgi:hypothetical protein
MRGRMKVKTKRKSSGCIPTRNRKGKKLPRQYPQVAQKQPQERLEEDSGAVARSFSDA